MTNKVCNVESTKCLTFLCSLGCLFILVELHHQVLLFSLHALLLFLDGFPPRLLTLQLIPAEHTEQILMMHFNHSLDSYPYPRSV